MLQFTDLNHVKHSIHLVNLNNVQLRDNNGSLIMSFHMNGNHVVPVTIDKTTADRLMKEMGAI